MEPIEGKTAEEHASDLKAHLVDLVDKYFEKGKSKERGEAMVLTADVYVWFLDYLASLPAGTVTSEEISHYIGEIGYHILDTIVSPICGIDGVMADLYLAEISTYTNDETEKYEIMQKVFDHYGLFTGNAETDEIQMNEFADKPIALLALYILEEGNFLEKRNPRQTE